MRSLLLIFATLFLLSGGFVAYWWVQSNDGGQKAAHRPPPRVNQLKANQGNRILGEGADIWIKKYDKKTGTLASQFRAAKYNPQPDDTVQVIQPEAGFFLSNGRVLQIIGASGSVTMPQEAGESNTLGGSPQSPSRGLLNDVTISLFESTAAADANEPELTVDLPNIAFDNETFRIHTAARQSAGSPAIDADQIPVTVRGKDYEFDGRGLTIRWNERDQQIQSFEIAHGGRLIIKNPNHFSSSASSTSTEDQRQPPAAQSADPEPLAKAIEPTTRKSKSKDQPVYRATFHDAVRIAQAGKDLITGENLHVDFRPTDDKTERAAPPPPAMRSLSGTIVPHDPPMDDTASPIIAADKMEPTAATQSSEPPAIFQFGDQPIEIYWTGKLTLSPLETSTESALNPGDAAVRMSGSPLVLEQEKSRIEAASMVYRTNGSTLRMDASAEIPLKMTDAQGSVIITESMKYSHADRVVVLNGKSRAHLPMNDTAAAKPQMLSATWTKSCTLHLGRQNSEGITLERADIQGDVKIEPPPSAQGPQTISCNQLTLQTGQAPDGKFYPRLLTAIGDVHVVEPEQELQAGRLMVTLAPMPPGSHTRPASDSAAGVLGSSDLGLQQLVASDTVKIVRGETILTGDELQIDGGEGDRRVILHGRPLAKISEKENFLAGPILQFFEKTGRAEVEGAGSMRMLQQPSPAAKPLPIEVTWNDGVIVESQANSIDVSGDVQVSSAAADGSIQTARSEKISMILASKPIPAAAPDKDSASASASMNFLEGKEIQSITLREKVEIQSVLPGRDGTPLQQMNLFTETVRYEMSDQRLVVPMPGRMLFVDHRPPPDKKNVDEPKQSALSDGRGETAFAWEKEFTYDQTQRQAVMDGGVVVVHHPSDDKETSYRLQANRLIADFLDAPATRPAVANPAAAPQLKLLTARGDLILTGPDMELTSHEMIYNPRSSKIIARGGQDDPAVFTGSQGAVSWQELEINTRTMDVRAVGTSGSTGR